MAPVTNPPTIVVDEEPISPLSLSTPDPESQSKGQSKGKSKRARSVEANRPGSNGESPRCPPAPSLDAAAKRRCAGLPPVPDNPRLPPSILDSPASIPRGRVFLGHLEDIPLLDITTNSEATAAPEEPHRPPGLTDRVQLPSFQRRQRRPFWGWQPELSSVTEQPEEGLEDSPFSSGGHGIPTSSEGSRRAGMMREVTIGATGQADQDSRRENQRMAPEYNELVASLEEHNNSESDDDSSLKAEHGSP
ncbi:hypothetical protein F4802DRAFT_543864 [Xylaria palmicola]|nr:hypothetical protein F4802DRAFT_543864 [Xylaria palmicola]